MPWDAVELPNLSLWKLVLGAGGAGVISIYETGEPLPKELLDKMLAAARTQAACLFYATIWSSACSIHSCPHSRRSRTARKHPRNWQEIKKLVACLPSPFYVSRMLSATFAGGYAAGYYIV